MSEWYAHSENDRNEKHPLAMHLKETARFAESFAFAKHVAPVFKIAALLHDFGKYQLAFQNYLLNGGRRGSVPHASWGAGYARIMNALEASIAIDGHHKGLPDRASWKSDTEPYKQGEVADFDRVIRDFNTDTGIPPEELQTMSHTALPGGHREVFIRCLFSALTDADWLSTEAHFEEAKAAIRTSAALPVEDMLAKLKVEFASKSREGDVNGMRNVAREQAIAGALGELGFYSLALPTGMGKTLISIAWALHHAKQNGLKRIIIVLPYISIIDQTAQELKRIFGEERILEHHSSFNEEQLKDADEVQNVEYQRKRLACENWDFPVIVTTTVQFFESLFSNRPSKCRKVHNIAEAAVIFDEVQTIPKEIILPTLGMLRDVQAVMRTSFLFCTATQPAFQKRSEFDGIDAITPLIKGSEALYDKTRRVEYRLLDELFPVESERLSESLKDYGAATLVIFNTKKSVLEFYAAMKTAGLWEEHYHLSTAMCPAHRKKTIAMIRTALAEHKRILVVSTQLIEAGVDFDFPVVFRALAPLEAIIQSAGRCNREGRMDGYGTVVIFKPNEARYPNDTYAACAGYAEEIIKVDVSQLYRHDVFEKYYANVFSLYTDQAQQQGIITARKEFNFETVNDSYRVINDLSEGLYVYNYGDESRQLLHAVQHKKFLSRDDYRRMQTYTVQVYDHFIRRNTNDIKTTQNGIKVWYGNYDQATGISVAPLEADNYVVG